MQKIVRNTDVKSINLTDIYLITIIRLERTFEAADNLHYNRENEIVFSLKLANIRLNRTGK